MGLALPVIGSDLGELDPKIFPSLAQHLPHPPGAVPVKIRKHRVGELDFRVVARDHSLRVAPCKRRVETVNQLDVRVHSLRHQDGGKLQAGRQEAI